VDSPFSQEAWAKQEKLNFPLLSDFNKQVSAAYGAMYEDLIGFKGVSKRSAFVIDKQGVVRYASVSDDAKKLPDFNAIKACLASLG
jgi:peroxiredoxin